MSSYRSAIHIVEQHHSVAREAVAFGQRDVEVRRYRRSTMDEIKILIEYVVQTDVAGGLFQYSTLCQRAIVRHMQGEGQLVVPP